MLRKNHVGVRYTRINDFCKSPITTNGMDDNNIFFSTGTRYIKSGYNIVFLCRTCRKCLVTNNVLSKSELNKRLRRLARRILRYYNSGPEHELPSCLLTASGEHSYFCNVTVQNEKIPLYKKETRNRMDTSAAASFLRVLTCLKIRQKL